MEETRRSDCKAGRKQDGGQHGSTEPSVKLDHNEPGQLHGDSGFSGSVGSSYQPQSSVNSNGTESSSGSDAVENSSSALSLSSDLRPSISDEDNVEPKGNRDEDLKEAPNGHQTSGAVDSIPDSDSLDTEVEVTPIRDELNIERDLWQREHLDANQSVVEPDRFNSIDGHQKAKPCSLEARSHMDETTMSTEVNTLPETVLPSIKSSGTDTFRKPDDKEQLQGETSPLDLYLRKLLNMSSDDKLPNNEERMLNIPIDNHENGEILNQQQGSDQKLRRFHENGTHNPKCQNQIRGQQQQNWNRFIQDVLNILRNSTSETFKNTVLNFLEHLYQAGLQNAIQNSIPQISERIFMENLERLLKPELQPQFRKLVQILKNRRQSDISKSPQTNDEDDKVVDEAGQTNQYAGAEREQQKKQKMLNEQQSEISANNSTATTKYADKQSKPVTGDNEQLLITSSSNIGEDCATDSSGDNLESAATEENIPFFNSERSVPLSVSTSNQYSLLFISNEKIVILVDGEHTELTYRRFSSDGICPVYVRQMKRKFDIEYHNIDYGRVFAIIHPVTQAMDDWWPLPEDVVDIPLLSSTVEAQDDRPFTPPPTHPINQPAAQLQAVALPANELPFSVNSLQASDRLSVAPNAGNTTNSARTRLSEGQTLRYGRPSQTMGASGSSLYQAGQTRASVKLARIRNHTAPYPVATRGTHERSPIRSSGTATRNPSGTEASRSNGAGVSRGTNREEGSNSGLEVSPSDGTRASTSNNVTENTNSRVKAESSGTIATHRAETDGNLGR